jgi:uncharacterized small protein (DUF1192 family)
MSFLDDDRPKKPVAHEVGADLSSLSVEEIDRRIGLLEEEIVRLRTERAKKQAGRAAADSIFKR